MKTASLDDRNRFGISVSVAWFFGFTLLGIALGQGPGRPKGPGGPGGGRPLREHAATEVRPVELAPATETLAEASLHEMRKEGERLSVRANAIPDHLVGRFPNRGNPHSIAPQSFEYSVPANPAVADEITPVGLAPFGFALNGVFFDPGAAEFWLGDRARGWQYEALGGAVPLGLDENFAHVQPTGTYHYHGIPALLLKRLGAREEAHSPQIGWAADGFPLYARTGFADPQDAGSEVRVLRSSWRLRGGERPDPPEGPGGPHDGAFLRDYEFVHGSGDLDECNGRFTVTPEFPEGTYAYFLTDEWPVVPRSFRGTPSSLRPQGRGPGVGGNPPR
jgi:hypothetical protein